MSEMNFKGLEKGIVQLIKKAETELPTDVVKALERAYKIEGGVAKTQIDAILKNIDLAKKSQRPMCQDTGIQTFFVDIGVTLKVWISLCLIPLFLTSACILTAV